ncbi:MAG: hypothetical protein GW772_11180 [Flavobacteriia bacterium]|nr:hypothetical protein [Flavobacteriia bacterium]OIP46746.1 MAG: hypothetical protein AUK46_07915 [Flavobacteriaceae bacterium CG2_30_31_66]PIV95803.1 MAG: hypothetical protein COW43_11750 [Flavobacteriaceae bacterium CG17_big_fil_post_rev_8_21_14_2_50_31_13]PIX13222.1 MAG: hypothetical protein COZ74_07395 [Flavobacteriaceae bacterium CG_4_8_14_3_um_filter_31_8]PIY16128.1 MAG: hypothetical protein COZ16_00810 [Flavobacteriaceae bacterium CG_4_10_14_3_um_filter_31_253]PIZ11319.1 MAG: hypotheti
MKTKINISEKVSKAIQTAKVNAKKANDFALNTTEEVVTETITVATQWQQITDKALKAGIKLMENQQNLVFDTLETYKNHFVKGKQRFSKLFA